MKKVLIIPDTHWDSKEAFHPSYLLVKKFAKAWKPEVIVHLGDMIDFGFISSFNREYLELIEGRQFIKEYDMAAKELDFWQGLKSVRQTIIRQGNHDQRVDRVLMRNPSFRGLIEMEEKLEYKARGIIYARETDAPTKLGRIYFIHGWYTTLYHAAKTWREWGDNMIYAHTHDFQSYSKTQKSDSKEYVCQSVGCLSDKYPDWMKGRNTKFMHGFAVAYLWDSGFFNLYPIRIIKNQFIYGGYLFKL